MDASLDQVNLTLFSPHPFPHTFYLLPDVRFTLILLSYDRSSNSGLVVSCPCLSVSLSMEDLSLSGAGQSGGSGGKKVSSHTLTSLQGSERSNKRAGVAR